MFKAYTPPPDPNEEDWIDGLINKGIPLAAAGVAAAASVPTAGMSLAAIPAVMGAASTGYGLANAATGALSTKPGSGARMERGMGIAAKGAALWNQIDPETGAFKDKDRGTPQTGAPQTGAPQTAPAGSALDAAKEKAKQTPWYSSPYASRRQGPAQ
jgi:hypothetical protein